MKPKAILAELRRLEAESPDALDLIHRTALRLGIKEEAVMDALENDVPKAPKEMPGLRAELFSDVASQFEKMEQVCSLAWMQDRNVSLEEVTALSGQLGRILRGWLALSPAERVAFVANATGTPPNLPASKTTLGERHNAAANHETTTE